MTTEVFEQLAKPARLEAAHEREATTKPIEGGAQSTTSQSWYMQGVLRQLRIGFKECYGQISTLICCDFSIEPCVALFRLLSATGRLVVRNTQNNCCKASD